MVAGMRLHPFFPYLSGAAYSESATSSKMGHSYPSRCTFAHPPTSSSPDSIIEPSRRSITDCTPPFLLTLRSTVMPASWPRYRLLRVARFTKASLPAITEAGWLPYFTM